MNWFTQSTQFKTGKSVEAALDTFFKAQGFSITRTSAHQERWLHLGDRIFRKAGKRWFVEYKSGIQTAYTGNVFLETISVDTPGRVKAGWVLTCRADFLVYGTILNGALLIFIPEQLRAALPALRTQFPEVATGKQQNKGYNTHGLLVPFGYARDHLAARVINLAPTE